MSTLTKDALKAAFDLVSSHKLPVSKVLMPADDYDGILKFAFEGKCSVRAHGAYGQAIEGCHEPECVARYVHES